MIEPQYQLRHRIKHVSTLNFFMLSLIWQFSSMWKTNRLLDIFWYLFVLLY